MAWLALAIPLILLGGLAVLLWKGARERKLAEAELAQIDALTMGEAKALALHLLQRSDLFDSKVAQTHSPDLSMPTSVRDLFEKYEEVALAEFWLGRKAVSQVARMPGYVKIGEDAEFTEILVRPGDENIYVSYGEAAAEDPLDIAPSVWHKIVEVSGIPLGSLRNAA